jgi:hypothetical protein
MAEEEKQRLRVTILAELLRQFPDLKPKIVIISEKTFTYELERNNNYTFYVVEYSITQSGRLKVNWDSAELTML